MLMILILIVLSTISNFFLMVSATQCSLLSHLQCSQPKEVDVGTDSELQWSISGDSMEGCVYYRVPDGGSYNSSHMISTDDPHFTLEKNTLHLININVIHEGKYYCVFNGGEIPPLNSSPCITVKGRPTFSCGTEDSANSDSVESCTSESIQIFNNNQLFLNTSLSFVGGGECQSESVHQIQLYYHEDVIWGYNFETLEIFERNVSMIQSDNIETEHHSFNFNIGHVNVNSSGLYELRVQLNDSENELIKTFNVTVTLNGEPPSTDVLTDNSTEVTMTSSTEAVPPNTQTTDSSTSAQIVEMRIYFVIMAVVGVCLIVVTLTVIVVIVTRKYRRVSNKSKVPQFDRTSIYGGEEELFLDDILNSQHIAHV